MGAACFGEIVCVTNDYSAGLFSVQEFMTFTSALIVERTSQGSRASVKEQGTVNNINLES